ncbi:MAG: hypothetical protein Kow00108_04220 [Calditrichia bacterium]
MAKKQDFASKVKGKAQLTCPVCNTAYQLSKVVFTNVESGKVTFKTQNTKICKCNEKEIYA